MCYGANKNLNLSLNGDTQHIIDAVVIIVIVVITVVLVIIVVVVINSILSIACPSVKRYCCIAICPGLRLISRQPHFACSKAGKGMPPRSGFMCAFAIQSVSSSCLVGQISRLGALLHGIFCHCRSQIVTDEFVTPISPMSNAEAPTDDTPESSRNQVNIMKINPFGQRDSLWMIGKHNKHYVPQRR